MGDSKCEVAGWISASPRQIFDAFTKPEILDQWFSSRSQVNLRVGGQYNNSDGDCGEFKSIVRNKEIVFTWDNPEHSPGTIVSISIDEHENRSYLRICHSELTSKVQADDMNRGWSWAIACLTMFLETGRIVTFGEWAESRR